MAKKKKVGKITKEFAANTTLHGVPQAIRAKSTEVKLFWTIMFILAICVFCFQATQLLIKYYQYPTKISFNIVQSSAVFPSVSLCNIRNFNAFTLNSLDALFKKIMANAQDPNHWGTNSDDPVIKDYLSTVAKIFKLYNVSNYVYMQDFLTRTTVASNIARHNAIKLGINLDELVVGCRFGDNKCDMASDFVHIFNAVYYNCYTYTATPQGPGNVAYSGLENAWSTVLLPGSGLVIVNEVLRLIPGTHDSHSIVSGSEGVRVVIHPPGTEPYPQSEGFDIPPG
jgi:hypothetical protein